MIFDPDKVTISYIIPVLNGEKYIKSCLDYICAAMAPDDEIIVVDNGSTDSTVAIAGGYRQVACLSFPEVTIATLRNRGAAVAKGDFFAFIDSDCLMSKTWRGVVVKTLSDESVGATGSTCDPPVDANWMVRAWQSSRTRQSRAIHYLNSANFVVKRQVFEEIGGFNEALITDEDSDIGRRVNLAGYIIIENPEASVINLGVPQTLGEYYRQKKWHAIGGLKLTSHGRWDKPMIMHVLFLLSLIATVLAVGAVVVGALRPVWLPIPLLLWVPATTALYQVMRYRNVRYLPHLVILFLIFFFARTEALIHVVSNRKAATAPAESRRG